MAKKKKSANAAAGDNNPLDISNLPAATADARLALNDTDPGPPEPLSYKKLRKRLKAAKDHLPPLYRTAVYEPFYSHLKDIGESGFKAILAKDPSRTRTAGLLLDIAQAILQNGEGYASLATDAFQEVVSDLYDGFLSAEDRTGVKPPDESVIPPLVKWGSPDFGPYTWPTSATNVFGVTPTIVSLPPANARRGLLAWSALGHETAGHDLLSADHGLKPEIRKATKAALLKNNFDKSMAMYWANRIDETASDVLGVLNMGPAAAIGLIGYFRGFSAAGKLRSIGPASDSHPADIVRGYLTAETVRLLSFKGAKAWADLIAQETDNDASAIKLAGETVKMADAKRSAQIVAETIATSELTSLEDHALIEIQDWRDEDEAVVQSVRLLLRTSQPSLQFGGETYAAHVIAAGVMESIAAGAELPVIFGRTMRILKAMHDGNPSWGPLYVGHPGDLEMHRVWV